MGIDQPDRGGLVAGKRGKFCSVLLEKREKYRDQARTTRREEQMDISYVVSRISKTQVSPQ